MSAWSDLPNAKHIDRVLAALKEHPEIWGEARDTTVGRGVSRYAAWSVAPDAARGEVWDAAMEAAQDAAWDVARDAARSAAFEAAYDAILALFAYDDCEQYLDMSSEQLHAWSLLTEQSAAMLLLPAVVAFERIKELESV